MDQEMIEAKLKELTIVYVEDEEHVREKVARALSRRVGTIHSAENGVEGLELIKKHKPDMVITDLEMPKMTGMEMIKQAKAHCEDLCAIPVVVVTAYRDDEHYTDLANLYVYKPVRIRELVDAMVNLMIKCHIHGI